MPQDKPIENNWQGVNQRIDPLLLPPNVYNDASGVVYRTGYAARIDGKKFFHKFAKGVVTINFSDSLAIIQTLGGVYTTTLDELFA